MMDQEMSPPNAIIPAHREALSGYDLRNGQSRAFVSHYGAQILDWEVGGKKIFFENAGAANLTGSGAVRRGAPLCFPYFGVGTLIRPDQLPLSPQHGTARSSIWQGAIASDGGSVSFEQEFLSIDNVPLHAQQVVKLESNALQLEFFVTNYGDTPTIFQIATHTYFNTSDPNQVSIEGLSTTYLDNRDGMKQKKRGLEALAVQAPIDAVFPGVGAQLILTTPEYSLHITTENLPDAVVWNAGEGHTIKDLSSLQYICLESGAIFPGVNIQVGEVWRGKVRYSM